MSAPGVHLTGLDDSLLKSDLNVLRRARSKMQEIRVRSLVPSFYSSLHFPLGSKSLQD